MKQIHAYKVDLTKIDGNGDFACPKCGTMISPNDDTEEVYSILEPKVKSQDLEELVIRCNRCASHINLMGFSLLQKIGESDEEKTGKQKEKETSPYFAHV